MSVLLGALVAHGSTITLVVGAAAISVAFILSSPQLAPLAVFGMPLAVAQISGIGGIATLLVCIIAYGLCTRAFLHPLVLYGSLISLYLLVGGANISTYRGYVSSSTLRFILIHVLLLLFGVTLAGGLALTRRSQSRVAALTITRTHLIVGYLPGLVGTLLILQHAGLVILHPNSREALSGATLLLAEMLLAGLALNCCYVFTQRTPRRGDWAIIALTLLGLANSGYRGWPIIGMIIVAASGVYFGRLRLTLSRVVGLALVCVLIIAVGSFIRRDTSANTIGELTTNQLAERYDAQGVPVGVRELHFAFREAIGITQILVEDRRIGRRIHGSLLLADFETMLPGKQPGGGQLIGQVVGIQGNTGLTGGAVGVAFMDIGYFSFALFFMLGLGIGWAWRNASRSPQQALLYLLVIIYSVQFFHRGVPKPSYLIVPLFFLLISNWRRRPQLDYR